MRIHPLTNTLRMHYGEDTDGDGNYSPVAGIVVYAGYHSASGFGYVVGVRESKSIVWWIAHNERGSIAVSVGQWVTQGQRIGRIGMTGTATGVHAHTERRVNGTNTPLTGTATNPRDFYATSGGGLAGGATTPLEDDMPNVKVIVQDAGGEGSPEYGSVAVVYYDAGYSRRLSTGMGPRGLYNGFKLVAGIYGYDPTLNSVDPAGWTLTVQSFPFGNEPGPSAEEIAAAVEARLADETDEIVAVVKAIQVGSTSVDLAPLSAAIAALPQRVRDEIIAPDA
jgi:hypothetical protein